MDQKSHPSSFGYYGHLYQISRQSIQLFYNISVWTETGGSTADTAICKATAPEQQKKSLHLYLLQRIEFFWKHKIFVDR